MISKIGSIASILLLVLVTIGSAGEIDVGGGTSVSVSHDSSAEGSLASDDLGMQSSLSSVGVIDDLNIDHWVKNTIGEYAKIGVTGTNVAGFSYSDNYYPVKDNVGVSNAVWAEQWIGASSADHLDADSSASNAAGDKAATEMTIDHGSLNDYYNSAYAGPAPTLGMDRGAFAKQTVESAKGTNILAQTYSNDAPGDSAGSRTEVNYGSLTGYSALADGGRYLDGTRAAGVRVDSLSSDVSFGSMNQLIWSQNYKGDRAEVGTALAFGRLFSYSYNSNYPSQAYSIGDKDITGAIQSVDASSCFGSADYVNSYGKFDDRFYGSRTYNQAYSRQRISFWNSAATLPTLANELHGTFDN
jgi:hypothetical protein